MLTIVSSWITYTTYDKHSRRISAELGKEATRIDNAIAREMGNANYMLSSIGRQIIIDPNRDYTKLAQSLKSFDSKNYIYSIFSWINTDKKLVVSSNKGILEEPVDISDRDYIQKAANDSWKMHIGRPIDGRVSGRWVIPVAMGITDYTGKFIGIVALSIDIAVLTEEISNLVKRDGISFAIVTKDTESTDFSNKFITLTEISDSNNFINGNFPLQKLSDFDLAKNTSGLIAQGSIVMGSGVYSYYRVSDAFPYIVLMGYDASYSDETVRVMLWGRLLQIFTVAIFFVFFLWIVRLRVISPVMDITEVVASIAKGNKFVAMRKKGQVELEALVEQVEQVSKYIDENKRIENELRNKMFMLKKAKENAELDVRSKSEFLAYIAQELRMPVNNIIGFAQVLKDQVYGAIENRKYRQYAADIFLIANQLIEKIQDINVHSKVESGYIELREKAIDISSAIDTALKQLEGKLQAREISINTAIDEALPQLLADEFRIQQVIANLLMIVLEHVEPDGTINLEARMVYEHGENKFLVLNIGDASHVLDRNDDFYISLWDNESKQESTNSDLRFGLAKILIKLHGGMLHCEQVGDEKYIYTVIFPDSRLVFND